MNAIFKRASVRAYTDQPVEQEKVDLLLRAAMAAPSGGNQQPWEFVVVTDDETRAQLAEVSPYAKPAGKAPLDIVLCMRTEGLRFPEIAEQDMGACAENILLEAVELGLGAVWQGIWPVPERMQGIKDLLGLPENIAAFAIISIGYPQKEPKQSDRFDATRVHYNKY